MPRIIAGTHGGRRLSAPAGAGTRPTSDRVREAIFGRLEHWDAIAGATVLDLYSGSGALALEAASRGAARIILVESNRKAAAVISSNVRALGIENTRVVQQPVERYVQSAASDSADLVFIDPPYDLGQEALAGVLADLAGNGWLSDQALLVVERSTRSPEPIWPCGYASIEGRGYGETTVWFADRPVS